MSERLNDNPSPTGQIKFLQFAVENLNRIRLGEGGTAAIDPTTGRPMLCEPCSGFIFHGHKCDV